jgi:hypothetical protein
MCRLSRCWQGSSSLQQRRKIAASSTCLPGTPRKLPVHAALQARALRGELTASKASFSLLMMSACGCISVRFLRKGGGSRLARKGKKTNEGSTEGP